MTPPFSSSLAPGAARAQSGRRALAAAVVALAAAGGCSVGEVGGGGGGGTDGGMSMMDDLDVCAPRVAAPVAAYQHVGNPTGARAGLGCLDAGCHGPVNPASTRFGFAGTVYTTAAGGTPAAGVTVRLFKMGEKKSLASAVTDTAGNFRIAGNFTAYPYVTHVSACSPAMGASINPMIQLLTVGAEMNCNTGGSCHVYPGQRPIYQP
jgi:hypothetical protein